VVQQRAQKATYTAHLAPHVTCGPAAALTPVWPAQIVLLAGCVLTTALLVTWVCTRARPVYLVDYHVFKAPDWCAPHSAQLAAGSAHQVIQHVSRRELLASGLVRLGLVMGVRFNHPTLNCTAVLFPCFRLWRLRAGPAQPLYVRAAAA
jgi:hypothetical protein